MIDGPHVIETVESSNTEVVRECRCGWVTVGTIPEPSHHTPLAEREAKHLEEAAKIADGTVWNEVPAGYSLRLHLRRRLRDHTPNEVVITAVWLGGSREVELFPWTFAGLAEAASWLDARGGATWEHNGARVDTTELTRYAP